ncbi:hypothetical protein ACQBAR_10280 [Propionibacteriaceae bacterium Y1685]
MYEMYPSQWGARADEAPETEAKPRRRARKQRPVAPRAIRVVPKS